MTEHYRVAGLYLVLLLTIGGCATHKPMPEAV